MNYVTSSQNQIIKEVKALKKRKYREEKNLFFIEGLRIVEEAFKENAAIVRLLLSERFVSGDAGKDFVSNNRFDESKCYVIKDTLFDEITDTESPQGILAVVGRKYYPLENIIQKDGFLVILDTIQDPGNMGTIIRTADASGASGVVLSKGCVDLYNPKVLRSTMGSIFRVPVFFSDDLTETINLIKSKGIEVFAAHLKGSISCFELEKSGDAAFIIGNEANGISDETAALADVLLKIPMPGRAESLNASIAAGLLMYEVVRRRLQKA